jgi:hypothetical protein
VCCHLKPKPAGKTDGGSATFLSIRDRRWRSYETEARKANVKGVLSETEAC